MDSLGKIRDTLPREVKDERELGEAFRAAAMSLTGLLKAGKKATKKGKQLA